MGILAISTSGLPSFAISYNGRVVDFQSVSVRSSEDLFVALDNRLKELEITLKELDEIIVDIGPGSFTGLRIGLSAVKVWAFIFPDLVIYPVSCLDIAAFSLSEQQPDFVVKDAGRENLFVADYTGQSKRYYLKKKELFWNEVWSLGEAVVINYEQIKGVQMLNFYNKNKDKPLPCRPEYLNPLYIYPDDCSVSKKN